MRRSRGLPGVVLFCAVALAAAAVSPMMSSGTEGSLNAAIQESYESYPSNSIEDQVSRLETLAWVKYPETFSGLWILEGEYKDGIHLAFNSRAAEKSKILAEEADFSWPGLLRPVDVRYAAVELQDIQRQISTDRELLKRGELQLPGLANGHFDSSVSYQKNQIEIFSPDASDEAQEAIGSRYGLDIKLVKAEPTSEYACTNRHQCGTSLRGGIASQFHELGTPASSYINCTTGFTLTTGALISAAHCGDNRTTGAKDIGNKRYHGAGSPGTLFGSVQQQQHSYRVDAERISVGNGRTAYPWIFKDQVEQAWNVSTVGTWAGFTLGQTFCKSAINSDRTCGVATDKDVSPSMIPFGERFLAVSLNATFGDSGGPLYQNHQAVGVLHGGGSIGTVFGHVQFVQNAFGINIKTTP